MPFSCIPNQLADLTTSVATYARTHTPVLHQHTTLNTHEGTIPMTPWETPPTWFFIYNIRCGHLHFASDRSFRPSSRLFDLNTHLGTHINARNTYTHLSPQITWHASTYHRPCHHIPGSCKLFSSTLVSTIRNFFVLSSAGMALLSLSQTTQITQAAQAHQPKASA